MDEGQLVWKLFTIGSVVANMVMAWVMWQGRNAKNTTSIEGEVSTRAAKDFVTKDHHDTEVKRLDKRIDDCQSGHKEGDGELEEDITRLGDKIEKVQKELSDEMKDRTGKLHARMDDFEKASAKIPAQTIALLKETKGLL